MNKKKRIVISNDDKPIVVNDLTQIYFYIRDIKKLYPIPYKWELDFKKINEFKKKINHIFTQRI
jgi:hypothetical protein